MFAEEDCFLVCFPLSLGIVLLLTLILLLRQLLKGKCLNNIRQKAQTQFYNPICILEVSKFFFNIDNVALQCFLYERRATLSWQSLRSFIISAKHIHIRTQWEDFKLRASITATHTQIVHFHANLVQARLLSICECVNFVRQCTQLLAFRMQFVCASRLRTLCVAL